MARGSPAAPAGKVRRAGPGDAAAIAALHIASWQTAYRLALPARFLDSLDLDERTSRWSARLAESGVEVLLNEDQRLLAFCAMGPSRDADAVPGTTWEIYNLHVSPGLKRRGIGGTLFDLALERGRGRGAAVLTLWVVRDNEPARRFYEAKGMRPDGAEQSHQVGPGASLREVRYRLKLG